MNLPCLFYNKTCWFYFFFAVFFAAGFSVFPNLMEACAADNLAIGTRKGEQLT